ncbi:hypothetical protein EDB87DRAFT_1715585 [Lactarius vividus]|nr:hypothetical protein EDB87DRAFT_1715585 [Lactarius vividus]
MQLYMHQSFWRHITMSLSKYRRGVITIARGFFCRSVANSGQRDEQGNKGKRRGPQKKKVSAEPFDDSITHAQHSSDQHSHLRLMATVSAPHRSPSAAPDSAARDSPPARGCDPGLPRRLDPLLICPPRPRQPRTSVASAVRRTTGSRPVRERCRSSISWNYFTSSMRSANERQKSYESLKAGRTRIAHGQEGPSMALAQVSTPRSRGEVGDSFPKDSRSDAGSGYANVVYTQVREHYWLRFRRWGSFATCWHNLGSDSGRRSSHGSPAGPDEHLVRVREVLTALSERMLRGGKADRLGGRESLRRSAWRSRGVDSGEKRLCVGCNLSLCGGGGPR